MKWYWDTNADGDLDVWDHTQAAGDPPLLTVANPDAPALTRDPQGIPVDPDIREAILQHLYDRGQADTYALIGVAAALTGAGFERGTPP